MFHVHCLQHPEAIPLRLALVCGPKPTEFRRGMTRHLKQLARKKVTTIQCDRVYMYMCVYTYR